MNKQQKKSRGYRIVESVFSFIAGMTLLWVVNPPIFIIVTIVFSTFTLTGLIFATVAFFKNDEFNTWVVGRLPK